jgi:hypothetical protein
MNRKEHENKLAKWEAEGYDVSELRRKWFPARRAGTKEYKANWLAIIIPIVIVITALTVWQAWPEPTIPASTTEPATAPEPVPALEPAPVIIWEKTFGGTLLDMAYSVQQTADGGYIVAGVTNSYSAGENDFYLVKTDTEGNEQWSKTFGGSDNDSARSVQQTADGGYIVAGVINSYSVGSGDAYLIKTDAKGNEQWSQTFSKPYYDEWRAVQQTADGGYIVVGVTQS